MSKCELCGEDMPEGEEMFKFHGYSGPCPKPPLAKVDSTSDARTVNNTVRHKYRVLTDAEKAHMTSVKDKGAEFLALIETLRTPSIPVLDADGNDTGMAQGTFDRELAIAAERIEEAVMWAVKHITA